MERCSNIFSFRVTDASAATEEGRERFTKSLQAANVRVSTGAPAHAAPPASAAAGCSSICWVLGTAGYGQDPSAGDQQAWPVFPLTVNPSLLRSDNATLIAAFGDALQAAAAANKL